MMARGAVLLLLAAAFAAALLPDAAESRILLTLHDFGAVGDGVADDTKVPPQRSARTHASARPQCD
jgi:galacturan 1,4-alpha-galacturonidase